MQPTAVGSVPNKSASGNSPLLNGRRAGIAHPQLGSRRERRRRNGGLSRSSSTNPFHEFWPHTTTDSAQLAGSGRICGFLLTAASSLARSVPRAIPIFRLAESSTTRVHRDSRLQNLG